MNSERIKVLYVDDEEGNLMAFRASFRRDYDVHVCSNVNDALALLARETMHVVISDQRMPGVSGAEFLAMVRERWPRSIRIMLTGFSDIEAVIDAINKGGIHAYITKPWDPIDLKLRIEQAYEVHALRMERERMFQRYRQVFDASGDPIVIVDEQGRFHDMNPAAEALMGLSRTELMERQAHDFIGSLDGLLRSLLPVRSGRTFSNVDISLRTGNERVVDCLMTVTYLGRTPAKQALFQAMLKDITDRKQEEQRLKKLNSELDKRVAVRTKQLMDALEDLGAFSYSVAHDLRSPLKSMRSLATHMCELAALDGKEELREVADRLHQNAARLINLVDDLLRFARTDSHEVRRTTVDVRDLALQCLSEMELTDRRMEIELPAAGEAVLDADPAMFRVVLTNLFSNALKFTRSRDTARISVRYHQEDGEHVLSMSDNGVGFEKDKGDQLFGVFKRLHRPDQFEGTGIGLAIVQRIVMKHGGTCKAEGAPDQGATIHIRLPLKPSEQQVRMAS